MSHFVPIKTSMKDVDSLVDALVAMGFKRENIEVHKTATTIRDYHKDTKKANVAIRKEYTGIPSDIGFEKETDGTFTSHLDDYDYSGWGNSKNSVPRYDEAWSSKLQLNYNMEASKKSFKQNGWEFTETRDKDNNPVLLAREKVQW